MRKRSKQYISLNIKVILEEMKKIVTNIKNEKEIEEEFYSRECRMAD